MLNHTPQCVHLASFTMRSDDFGKIAEGDEVIKAIALIRQEEEIRLAFWKN